MTTEEMNDRDIIELTSEDGDTLEMEVAGYFNYNGQEYAVMYAAEGGSEDEEPYIMKVVTFVGEDGEPWESFEGIDDGLYEEVIEAYETLEDMDDGE